MSLNDYSKWLSGVVWCVKAGYTVVVIQPCTRFIYYARQWCDVIFSRCLHEIRRTRNVASYPQIREQTGESFFFFLLRVTRHRALCACVSHDRSVRSHICFCNVNEYIKRSDFTKHFKLGIATCNLNVVKFNVLRPNDLTQQSLIIGGLRKLILSYYIENGLS